LSLILSILNAGINIIGRTDTKEADMNDVKKRAYELAKDFQLINLATITEDGKPWVRYVSGKADQDLTVRFCTHLDSDKVREMKKNANVHISLGASNHAATGWLQIAGTAEVSTAKSEREAFWIDGFKRFFSGPDDPKFCVVIVKPIRIELGSAASRAPEVWAA
jgi:general stress protein 26